MRSDSPDPAFVGESEEAHPDEVRLVVALSLAEIERIARRAAELVEARAANTDAARPYLSVLEAADYLRCSRQRVYDLLSQGALSRLKDGGRVLVRRAEVDAYLSGVPTGRFARGVQRGRKGAKSPGPDLAPARDVPTLFPPGPFRGSGLVRKRNKNPA